MYHVTQQFIQIEMFKIKKSSNEKNKILPWKQLTVLNILPALSY